MIYYKHHHPQKGHRKQMNIIEFPHPNPVLTIEHLSVNYRGVEALRDICLNIQPGRLTGIIGRMGRGKVP